MKNIENHCALSAIRPLSTWIRLAIKPIVVLTLCVSSISTYAAVLSIDNERRIQVRPGSGDTINAYITSTTSNTISGDSMQGLIEKKQQQYDFDARVSIEESKRVYVNKPSYNTRYVTTYPSNYGSSNNTRYGYNNTASMSMDFGSWLNSNSWRAEQVNNYKRYLSAQVGAQNVPPLEQLLTTARSWDKCGYEPYQLPPQELWANIVPTLRLYNELKSQGILPASTEIRSVYRSPSLNACAGGADASKHMTAGAMDIWVPEYENDLWRTSKLQDSLCQFWQYQGVGYNFGLGLYSTGAIHLDTQGYRKWGFQHASSSSACRY
ncbi:MAG: D-Ala-D-Ala carboxypeptidase family metallohydrolase [Psychrobacter sp.]|nr:D-Ala-D-Ala carboxypeptidase family metallohydrolase [Psychrobacter sp.]